MGVPLCQYGYPCKKHSHKWRPLAQPLPCCPGLAAAPHRLVDHRLRDPAIIRLAAPVTAIKIPAPNRLLADKMREPPALVLDSKHNILPFAPPTPVRFPTHSPRHPAGNPAYLYYIIIIITKKKIPRPGRGISAAIIITFCTPPASPRTPGTCPAPRPTPYARTLGRRTPP